MPRRFAFGSWTSSLGLFIMVSYGPGVVAPVAATTLAEVVGNGRALSGQRVTVSGTVADPRLGYAGETTYTLTNGVERLAILGKGNAPTKGVQLQVTGTVGFKEPDEEFTWPPILLDATWQATP